MPFIITLLSGLSTLLGFITVYLKVGEDKIISYSLFFSSIVMIVISVFNLIPESMQFTNNKLLVSIFIFLGLMMGNIFDKLLNIDNKLKKVGLISLFALILHNIPEGIITFATSSLNIKLGIGLGFAIALHNIPEGICISIPIYYSTKSYKKSFIYTLIASLSEPLGALIGLLFINYINYNSIGLMYAFIAGLMIYISVFELIPQIKFKD